MRERELPLGVSRDVQEILEKLKEEEERPRNLYELVCSGSRRLLGWFTKDMGLQENTIKNLSWAGLRVTPEEWWAGFFLVTLLPIVVATAAWVILALLGAELLSLLYLPALGLVIGGLLGASFYYYPASVANINQSEAQSKAIETVMLLSFALHHRPDLRGALTFAANASDGKLAEDIRRGLLELDEKRGYESTRHFLTILAHRWRDIDEGTRRAIFDILRSTGQREEAARQQDVAKAPRRVLESSEQQLELKLNSLVTPTITFLVFGSIAIVAVIGLSPIFGMVGLNFVDLKFFTLAAGALIISFFAFTIFMVRQRPAVIPPPEIPADDPRLPPPGKFRFFGHVLPLYLPVILVSATLAAPGIIYLLRWENAGWVVSGPNTFWLIWAVTGGLAIYSHLYIGAKAKVRNEVQEEMADWSMALNIMGSRIIDGLPMHQAMRETSGLMSETAVGRQLKNAGDIMEKFSVDAQHAFFESGVARRIYSPLVSSLLGVITMIKRGSEVAAGRACMMAAELLDTLREVERRFREKIDDATSNLWMMSVILLPTVCALSVWVMELMSEMSLTVTLQAEAAGLANFPFLTAPMESSDLALLKLLMGSTAITLSLIVARYIAIIRGGRDPVEFWRTVAPTTLVTTIVFTVAYIGFGLLTIAGG
ncbi:MAG: hypothetical protein J7J17_03545 [Hadesarchaea archaeon]|nr:hypothetical protein [Hadesarchaea archaeon]